jgi:small-conductance mechanosensitive channel/CRP-like cAMP-binding protein
MSAAASRVAAAAWRILPPALLLAVVALLVPLLPRFGIAMTGPGGKDYGEFAIGVAAAFLLARILGFFFFDVVFPLRRGTEAPALLRQLVGLFVFVAAVAALFQIALKANLAAILTTSAIITAVIGLALQETLGNLFSGLALALERTVQVGDMVRAGDRIGLVEQLSWRAIKVRTMEGNTLLIPNSVASRERLEVFRRGGVPMARTLPVGLEYDARPARARSVLEAAARDVSGVASRPAPVAYLSSFDAYAVTYELRYWLEDYARYLEIDSRVRERVWYRLGREGLVIAYPIIRQHQYAAGPLHREEDGTPVPAAISRADIFAPLSAAEQAALASRAALRRFADGEVIVREGDATSSMFLVAQGQIVISARGERDTTRKLAVLDPGAAFGEISLLTGEPRLATARAVGEATLVEIDKGTLAPVLEANPSLAEKLGEVIAERRRQTADRLGDVASPTEISEAISLRTRIARFFGLKGLA